MKQTSWSSKPKGVDTRKEALPKSSVCVLCQRIEDWNVIDRVADSPVYTYAGARGEIELQTVLQTRAQTHAHARRLYE